MKRHTSRIDAPFFGWPILLVAILFMGGVSPALSWPAAAEVSTSTKVPGDVLSKKAAEVFEKKLIELSSPSSSSAKSLPSIVLTDQEVNSYLQYDRPAFLPPGITNLVIHFKPDGIHGSSDVDFDSLQSGQKPSNDFGNKILASIFRGKQPVTALAKIASNDGTAKLTIQDVHVGSIALSDWLVNWLIQTYVQSQYKIDLNKPLLLPPNVKRIDFAPGKAIFVRSPEKKNE